MKIEVSADSRAGGSSAAIAEVSALVEKGLARFSERLTRVEVHLSDINGARGGIDRRCQLEARAAARNPVSVDHEAGSEVEAVRGAIDKMVRLLTSTFDRLNDHRGGVSASGEPT